MAKRRRAMVARPVGPTALARWLWPLAWVVVAFHVPSTFAALPVHAPITIGGDADFCDGDADGVVNCSTADGSQDEPYVIQGWSIEAGTQFALQMTNVQSHVVIRSNQFVGPGSNQRPDGVWIANAPHVTFERNVVSGFGRALYLLHTEADVSRNVVSENSLAVFAIHSTVTVENNRLSENIAGLAYLWSGGPVMANEFYGNRFDLDVFEHGPAPVTASYNNFIQTEYSAVSNFNDQGVDATCNYWDHSEGPSPDAYQQRGARVQGNVVFDPFLREAHPWSGPDGFEPQLYSLERAVNHLDDPCYRAVPGGPV